MKYEKLLKLSALLMMLCVFIMLWSNISYAGTLSSDIAGIDDKKYPGVKSHIQALQKKHSNYEFQIFYTGIDWTEAVTMEYQGHGNTPKNLFSLSKNYQGKWYCPICGSKTYDTGWYCASIDAIKYMMDPRNSFDETSIFQFKSLETPDVSSENIQAVINNKYSSYGYINNPTTINAIVKASSDYKMNGYSILAKIVNEQGKGTSPLATGAGYNGEYVGYYNFFNVGAYGNGTSTVIKNGLKYAKNKGWDSVEKAILGGSEYYKSSYIGRGQNTLYYQRFNVVHENSLFSHQYQQDIMGAQTSATLLKSYYTISDTISTVKHAFIIPLYENMPATASSRPSTTENSELKCEEATVLQDKLAVVASPNSTRIVTYLNKDEKIKVLERASNVSSDGNYWDTIVSETDGSYGYVLRSGISQKLVLPEYIFDAKYYAEKNPDIKASLGEDYSKLVAHFVAYGIQEGRASSPTFDVKYYLENNGDIKAVYKNDYLAAYNHFVNFGSNEYRKSSSEYDGEFYRYYYSDLKDLSAVKLMEHYLEKGKDAGMLGGLEALTENIVFDANIYASCNIDIRNILGTDQKSLKLHWLQYGIAEGRQASLVFDPQMYGLLNGDLQVAFGNNYRALFEHFVRGGIHEKRSTNLMFDIGKYLDENGDIKAVFGTDYKQVYAHFRNYGANEGRNASHVYDVKTYLDSNPDLKVVYGNNYESIIVHFLNYGIHEPRKTSTGFDVTYYSSTYGDLKNVYGEEYRNYYVHYLLYGKPEGRKGAN